MRSPLTSRLVEPVVVRPLLVEWEAEKDREIAAELELAEAAKSSAARTKR